MRLYSPWEKAFKKVSTPFEHFLHEQTTSGIVLMFMTIIALILANSPLAQMYEHFFHTNIEFNVGSWKLSHSLLHWVNDGLMAVFFFLVGLEIKREVTVGELSDIKVAILPIICAIGGMLFPALIYFGINSQNIGANGWGIPMATDIAFAISVLVLLGKRIPTQLVTFLVALAIVDDLGAVLVIATFYTEQINMLALGLASASFMILFAFNRFGIHMILPYFVVGLIMWFFMLESGVHATIAGVLAALIIPSMPKKSPTSFAKNTKELLSEYEQVSTNSDLLNEKQKTILKNMTKEIDSIGTPSDRLEHNLHLPVALLIIPIFALGNAGVFIDFSSLGATFEMPVTIGIILGLILGKILGIFGVAYVAIKLKIATLPKYSTLKQIFGVSLLGGIGFTMSIFVADLAFVGNDELIFQAKIGILTASLLAGVFGYLWLKYIATSSKN